MTEFEFCPADYGREGRLFYTKKSCGMYYYATFEDGKIIWHRQIREEEARPLLILPLKEAMRMADCINPHARVKAAEI